MLRAQASFHRDRAGLPHFVRPAGSLRLATSTSFRFAPCSMPPAHSSLEVGVIVTVGRSAAAEEAEGLAFVGGELVPGGAGDEDGVAGGDGLGFAVEFHEAGACEDEVEFLAELVVVALGGGAGGEGGFGEALELDGGVGAVEDAADGGAVLGGEGGLGGKRVDCHGGRGIVSPLGRVPQAGLRGRVFLLSPLSV